MFVSDPSDCQIRRRIYGFGYTVCPSLGAVEQPLKKRNLPVRTHYSSHFSSRLVLRLLLLSAVLLIVGVRDGILE
jgi:hypothetical protein